MKLSRPIVPLQLEKGIVADLHDGEVEAARFVDVDLSKLNVSALSIDGVVFEKVSFLQTQLLRMVAKDIIIRQSDLSSTAMTDAAINRAEFVNCRMTGVDFSKAQLHDVVFRGCKLDLANFRFADIRRAKFIDCTFVETDFLGATLYDVSFETCTFEKTIFDQAKCKQVDLRTSYLGEISGWGSLKGTTIDNAQLVSVAAYLAREVGVIVVV